MGRAEDLFRLANAEGETFIQRLIAEGQSEELLIDYKRSSDNGKGVKLAPEDRKNTCERHVGLWELERWHYHRLTRSSPAS
jgi:hypothetical protein